MNYKMQSIPLFPLNTVLFPGMPLALRIFEERYKKMIRLCLKTESQFGVVLIRKGQEAFGPLAEPHEVGCTAKILEIHPRDNGVMDIVVLGQERFRVFSLDSSQDYLVGNIELYPLDRDNLKALTASSMQLRPLVERYMRLLNSTGKEDLDPQHLPDDPIVLAYLAAVLLKVPPHDKQKLLDIERSNAFLSNILSIYRREVALMGAMLGSKDQDTVFSNN
jgi:Lon protease-like protein